jgi:hypothetical protein
VDVPLVRRVHAVGADEATSTGQPLLLQRVDEGDRGGLRRGADDVPVVADARRRSGVGPRGSDDDEGGVRGPVPDRGDDLLRGHANPVGDPRGVEAAAEQDHQVDLGQVCLDHEVG